MSGVDDVFSSAYAPVISLITINNNLSDSCSAVQEAAAAIFGAYKLQLQSSGHTVSAAVLDASSALPLAAAGSLGRAHLAPQNERPCCARCSCGVQGSTTSSCTRASPSWISSSSSTRQARRHLHVIRRSMRRWL